MSAVILESTITGPDCGASRTETMPVNACQVHYIRSACRADLRPETGDCRVFRRYGPVPCPPIRLAPSGRHRG